jgi:hypothetical protein
MLGLDAPWPRYPQSSTSQRLLSIPPVVAFNRIYNKSSRSLSFMGFREESKTVVVWSAVTEESEEISEL